MKRIPREKFFGTGNWKMCHSHWHVSNFDKEHISGEMIGFVGENVLAAISGSDTGDLIK
tara:strand:- start:63 stop:239 length:177 start_codon:yes stop_codon:yes gene_type:complete